MPDANHDDDSEAVHPSVLAFQRGLLTAEPEFLAPLRNSFANFAVKLTDVQALLLEDQPKASEMLDHLIQACVILDEDISIAIDQKNAG